MDNVTMQLLGKVILRNRKLKGASIEASRFASDGIYAQQILHTLINASDSELQQLARQLQACLQAERAKPIPDTPTMTHFPTSMPVTLPVDKYRLTLR